MLFRSETLQSFSNLKVQQSRGFSTARAALWKKNLMLEGSLEASAGAGCCPLKAFSPKLAASCIPSLCRRILGLFGEAGPPQAGPTTMAPQAGDMAKLVDATDLINNRTLSLFLKKKVKALKFRETDEKLETLSQFNLLEKSKSLKGAETRRELSKNHAVSQ